MSALNNPIDFFINGVGYLNTKVLLFSDLATEEDHLLLVTKGSWPQFVAHA